MALYRLGALTGEPRYTNHADQILQLVAGVVAGAPSALLPPPRAPSTCAAPGITEIAVAGDRPDLVAAVAASRYLPNAVLAWGERYDVAAVGRPPRRACLRLPGLPLRGPGRHRRTAAAELPDWSSPLTPSRITDAGESALIWHGLPDVIDVSENQGTIDFGRMAAAGVDGVIPRAGINGRRTTASTSTSPASGPTSWPCPPSTGSPIPRAPPAPPRRARMLAAAGDPGGCRRGA